MKKFLLPVFFIIAGACFLAYPYLFLSGKMEVKIEPAAYIMPAAYKVYANPDVAGGRYHLFKAIIKNTGESTIHNLRVQYKVPKYIDDWTDVSAPSDLLPGQSAVVTCFPVFDQSITAKKTSSKERTEIRFLYGGKSNPTEKDESFAFEMTSVNDIVYSDVDDKDKAYYSDFETNLPLYACFVASHDPIIEYYTQQVQQKVLQGEQAAGVGTTGEVGQKQIAEALRVMEGVYNATLLTKMVYSETEAGGSKFGDITSSTEHIRLPREVVTGNTGLCIELALLHASVLKAAGDHPVIFLIPGHAFPGIKFGNTYYAIEATGIGGAGLGSIMTADQALQTGEKELNDFFTAVQNGKPGYYMLDIDQLSDEGYSEMELKDDSYLRQKIDQLAENFQGKNEQIQQEQQTAQNVNTETRHINRESMDNGLSMNRFTGSINFEYPANWVRRDRPIQQLPILTTMFESAGLRHGAVEIYQVPGASDIEQAMEYIQQSLSQMGVQIRYQQDGQQNGLTRFTGISASNGNTIHWESFLRVVNGGVVGVVVGSGPNSNLGSIQRRIMNTVN